MNFTKVLLAIVGIAFLGGCASGGIMQPSSSGCPNGKLQGHN